MEAAYERDEDSRKKFKRERYEENDDEAIEIFYIYMLLFFMNTTNN